MSAINLIDVSQRKSVLLHKPEDQVISVETGITIADLSLRLRAANQWVPISMVNDKVTLQEIILKGDPGPFEHYLGSLRRLILGLTVVLGDGRHIRCGGQVVKNVTGYDITKLFVGNYGYFGVPYVANLRLFSAPRLFRTQIYAADSPLTLIDFARDLIMSNFPIVAMDIVKLANDEYSLESGRFNLLVRVAGDADTVNDIMQGISKVSKDSSVKILRNLEAEPENKVWLAAMSWFYDSHFDCMNIATSKKLASALLARLNHHEVNVDYRPGVGRLILAVKNITFFDQVIEILQKLVSKDESASVSYPTQSGKLRFMQLGNDATKQLALFRNLKEAFDPGNQLGVALEFV